MRPSSKVTRRTQEPTTTGRRRTARGPMRACSRRWHAVGQIAHANTPRGDQKKFRRSGRQKWMRNKPQMNPDRIPRRDEAKGNAMSERRGQGQTSS